MTSPSPSPSTASRVSTSTRLGTYFSAEIERQLLLISPRQMERRLKERKLRLKRRIYGRTKPGTLLKHHIAIRTEAWSVNCPGFLEVDLVSHSGNSAEGEFVYSLNVTDIHTTWVETRAVLGKGQLLMVAALEQIRAALPFELKGIDPDNGSEFINRHLLSYSQSRRIQFTRGRPYKKDDNAHVEQKNWTHVRKLLGYARYDSPEALAAINELYRKESATDPFLIGEFRKQSIFQSAFQLKFEIRARLPFKDSTLAVGSYNYHQNFFGRHLNITLPDGSPAHTGCVAFGLERMAYAFLAQYGLEPQAWPSDVREALK